MRPWLCVRSTDFSTIVKRLILRASGVALVFTISHANNTTAPFRLVVGLLIFFGTHFARPRIKVELHHE